jgi:hypothetical protein
LLDDVTELDGVVFLNADVCFCKAGGGLGAFLGGPLAATERGLVVTPGGGRGGVAILAAAFNFGRGGADTPGGATGTCVFRAGFFLIASSKLPRPPAGFFLMVLGDDRAGRGPGGPRPRAGVDLAGGGPRPSATPPRAPRAPRAAPRAPRAPRALDPGGGLGPDI